MRDTLTLVALGTAWVATAVVLCVTLLWLVLAAIDRLDRCGSSPEARDG